jgi:hypothetical protein
MKKLIPLILSVLVIISCQKENVYPYPCLDGECKSTFYIDTFSSPSAKLHADGYWRVKYVGLHYFTIRGEVAELNPHYVINNVPLIETRYDSDYWIVFDTLKFKTPMYSYLGWYSDKGLNTPVPIGDTSYSITQLSKMTSFYNLAGYQITKYMCLTCAYSPTLLGSYSKYNYIPTQNFFLDKSMIGDTASIFINVLFNSDAGKSELREKEMKVIFE